VCARACVQACARHCASCGIVATTQRSGRVVELFPLHQEPSSDKAGDGGSGSSSKGKKGIVGDGMLPAGGRARQSQGNSTRACWIRHAGPTGMLVQQLWGSDDGSVLALDGHGSLYQRTWSNDVLWWVPNAKPGFPMRPTWGNGGASLGNAAALQHDLANVSDKRSNGISKQQLFLVGLNGRLYERGYSALDWMHPDRFSWVDLGQPPAPASGVGGAAGEFGDGTVKLVDCLDAHALRRGSILVLSWKGEVWEVGRSCLEPCCCCSSCAAVGSWRSLVLHRRTRAPAVCARALGSQAASIRDA
jgi:hypothetical protein